MRLVIRDYAVVLAIAFGTYCAPAIAADAYPTKPIRLVVPFPPGGGSDIVSRIVGKQMTESLGQTIVVDNRPGAGGILGTHLVANAPADGYTLLIVDPSFTISPSYFLKLVRYDAQKSFVPVALIAETPSMLAVHPGVPAATLKDFIALAKAQPNKLNVGSSGTATGSHLAGELFKLKADINLNHIPYGGTGPALADLMGGQIQASFLTAAGAMPLVKSGRLKALAVASSTRSAMLPDVPTFVELGFTDLVVSVWYGVIAPAGTPQPVVKRLYDEIGRATAQPDVRERLVNILLEPVRPSPDQFRQLIDLELKRWAQVIKDARIPTQ